MADTDLILNCEVLKTIYKELILCDEFKESTLTIVNTPRIPIIGGIYYPHGNTFEENIKEVTNLRHLPNMFFKHVYLYSIRIINYNSVFKDKVIDFRMHLEPYNINPKKQQDGKSDDTFEKIDVENFIFSEQTALETTQARLDIFKEVFTRDEGSPVSVSWAMKEILGMTSEEIKEVLKFDARSRVLYERRKNRKTKNALTWSIKHGSFKDFRKLINSAMYQREFNEDGKYNKFDTVVFHSHPLLFQTLYGMPDFISKTDSKMDSKEGYWMDKFSVFVNPEKDKQDVISIECSKNKTVNFEIFVTDF